MRFIAKILAKFFKWKYEDKSPDFIIFGEDDQPYMLRWWVIPRNKYFNIYLHKVIGDDDRAMHDHPWNSLGLILEGTYLEIIPIYQPIGRKMVDKSFGGDKLSQGRWKYRDTDFAHYLLKYDEEPVWTLFFTGPKKRDWGFYHPESLNWVDHVTWCKVHGKEITYE